jgi:glycosyltransferase involved in cell wall biosynthesis
MGIVPIKRVRARTQKILWPLHRLLSAGYFVRLCARVGATLEPAAYHCHDQNTVLAGQLARRRAPGRVIYDAHELYPYRNRPNPCRWKSLLFEIGDRYSARRCDAVITVNQSIAEHMGRRYEIDPVDVVMNIPEVGGRMHDEDADVLDLSHIPRPRLFYCGNITFNRGLEEAVASLVELPDCSLVVVGQGRGTYADDLRSLAASVGVQDRLHIFPPVPHQEVVRVAAQADIGLVMIKPSCLSYEYALPNKLFECLHAGLPMVASDLPELRRVVLGEEVGLVCDHDDPGSIAEAVKAIIADPELSEKMRLCAITAAETYTWDREREYLFGVYRRLGLLRDGSSDPTCGVRRVPAPAHVRRSTMPSKVPATADPIEAEPPSQPTPEPADTTLEKVATPRGSTTRMQKTTFAYRAALRVASKEHLHDAIEQHVPEGARVAVVTRGDDELLELPGYDLGHFPQASDAEWLGYHPADDDAAIAELRKVEELKYEFLAFPMTSLWWLDHYLAFRALLEQETEVIWASTECTIFRIGRATDGMEPGVTQPPPQ